MDPQPQFMWRDTQKFRGKYKIEVIGTKTRLQHHLVPTGLMALHSARLQPFVQAWSGLHAHLEALNH